MAKKKAVKKSAPKKKVSEKKPRVKKIEVKGVVEKVITEPIEIPEEVVDLAPVKEEIPEAIPVLKDTEQKVAAIALVDALPTIGGIRYILEKGQEVRGGILLAHLPILERAGKVKRSV